jgi:hypothetical protein
VGFEHKLLADEVTGSNPHTYLNRESLRNGIIGDWVFPPGEADLSGVAEGRDAAICDRLAHEHFMSNRAKWAHQNRAKQGPDIGRIPVGLAFLGLGSVLLFGALEGMRAHIWMFPAFSFRLGTFVIGQTIGLLVLGAAFIVAGITILVVRH